jgi:glutathione peroxidase
MFEKVDVNGPNAHPLYKHLCEEKKGLFGGAIKWNFTKFLVDAEGNVVDRFAPITAPSKLEEKIVELINQI